MRKTTRLRCDEAPPGRTTTPASGGNPAEEAADEDYQDAEDEMVTPEYNREFLRYLGKSSRMTQPKAKATWTDGIVARYTHAEWRHMASTKGVTTRGKTPRQIFEALLQKWDADRAAEA